MTNRINVLGVAVVLSVFVVAAEAAAPDQRANGGKAGSFGSPSGPSLPHRSHPPALPMYSAMNCS